MIIACIIAAMVKTVFGLLLFAVLLPSGICIWLESLIYSFFVEPFSERHPVTAKVIMAVLSVPTALVITGTLMFIIDQIKDIIK